MSLESDQIECLVRNGLSYQAACVLAPELAAMIAPMIERERLECACRDLFYTKSRAELAKEYRVHRSTVYRVHEKVVAELAYSATKSA